MSKKVEIGENGKVNVKWTVLPMDYSKDGEETIKNKVAKKYGISKDHVGVEAVFVQKNSDGEIIPITNDITHNIQNKEFQQKLFKEYIAEREIKDYDFDKIIEIDELINNNMNYEVYDASKRYTFKWIRWSNFMSYGEDNFFDFTTLKGLVLLCSEPANQGGKSTFCLDLFRFLLFGKVTSRENDWVLAKTFNKHLPDATEVLVEGCIVIDGNEYVIRRTVTRPAKNKRTDKSKVTQKVNYFRIVNNEFIELSDPEKENEEESTTTETNKAIREAIGNERDFDLMICVNSDNLKGLISLKDTERGRLISRWIGLLPLEDKEEIAGEIYNKKVYPSLLLNRYNSEELKNQIEVLDEQVKSYTKEVDKLKVSEKEATDKIDEFNKTKETLLNSRPKIDSELVNVDVKTVENEINSITEKGKRKRAELNENTNKRSQITCNAFDEENYKEVDKKCSDERTRLAVIGEQEKNLNKDIDVLKKSEICPVCGRKFENVDNSEAIKLKEVGLKKLEKEKDNLEKELKTHLAEKEKLEARRKEFNEGEKLDLKITANKAEIKNLIEQYNKKKTLLSNIEANKSAIEKNNEIDTSLNIIKANTENFNNFLKSVQSKIMGYENNIKQNENTIKQYNEIIATLDEEAKLVRNWKIYREMIGKNGISKLVLRNTLPLINGELKRLLNDVCDFYIEISIDDRNDVAFSLIHDGVKSNLASGSGFEQTVASLALRSVLNKISTFSKPSFVVFDEILGGVSDDNYDNIKLLYDKIVKDYDFVFQITHLKQIADWHDKTIIVRKENNISKIETA